MESSSALPASAGRTAWFGRGWRNLVESRPVLAIGYAASAALTAAAVGLGSSPSLSGPLGPASPLVMTLLGLNLALILALSALVGWRVLQLLNVQDSDAGARLHLRFVALFALAAVTPALIVALFFGVLVTSSVDNWFSARVQTVVENSGAMAHSYVEEQKNYIGTHIAPMEQRLDSAAPTLAQSPVAFSLYLRQLAADNGFSAAYLIDRDGRVLSRAESDGGATFLTPPEKSFRNADEGDVSLEMFQQANVFRALYRLRAFPDAYLYVVRPVETGIISHLFESDDALDAYRQAKARKTHIELGFALSYAETVLWVLLGAVSLGMSAASSISAPVARLVQAAGRVAGGDLTVRVESDRDPDEIAVLSRAFNSMTGDLEAQQEALRAAHKDAESRRQFIETVLFGVSAGVIGLDAERRVSVANRQAAALLELPPTRLGRLIGDLAPEFLGVVDRAGATGLEVEEDVDLVRGAESYRLRVRASPGPDGLVLTFDDITRLVAAQRNAAWKDVARRIAHEIKNPLTPIQLSAERLRRKYRKDITHDLETFDRCTDTIIRQVSDIGRMVDEFSSFARMPAPKFAEHELAELLRQAVFAQRVADPDVAVEIAEPLPELRALCDARMIGQALTNVLKNAGEAIAARRARRPDPPGVIRVRLVVTGGVAGFDVEDNGVGLPAKDRDRLTEPYVTTREKGTGLGLAIVKRIMEEHGGDIVLGDAVGNAGAHVMLRLPHIHTAERTPAPAAVTA